MYFEPLTRPPAVRRRRFSVARPYAQAPRRIGGPAHAEARYVTNTRHEKNLDLSTAAAALAHKAAGAGTVALGAWLGPQIAKGAYGTAYRTSVTPQVHAALETIRKAMSNGVFIAMPPVGSTVVIKVAEQKGPLPQFVKDSVKENTVHAHLATSQCTSVGPGFSKGLCASAYVPKMYFSGLVIKAGAKKYVYLTVMALARGTTVDKYLGRGGGKLTPQFYVKMERAICTMWAAGLVHADLHMSNIMYDPANSGTFTIIDFGFGVVLPDALRQRVVKAMAEGVARGSRSMGELWRSGDRSRIGTDLQAYTNRVISTRKAAQGWNLSRTWYNPDGKSVMAAYNKLSPSARAAVPLMRQKLWGYLGAPPPRAAGAAAGSPRRATTTAIERRRMRIFKAKCRAQGKQLNPRDMTCVRR